MYQYCSPLFEGIPVALFVRGLQAKLRSVEVTVQKIVSAKVVEIGNSLACRVKLQRGRAGDDVGEELACRSRLVALDTRQNLPCDVVLSDILERRVSTPCLRTCIQRLSSPRVSRPLSRRCLHPVLPNKLSASLGSSRLIAQPETSLVHPPRRCQRPFAIVS